MQHSLTADGGYTTHLELEAELEEDPVADCSKGSGAHTPALSSTTAIPRPARSTRSLKATGAALDGCGIYMSIILMLSVQPPKNQLK